MTLVTLSQRFSVTISAIEEVGERIFVFLCFSMLWIDILNAMHIIIGVVIRRPMKNILRKSMYLQIQKPTAF